MSKQNRQSIWSVILQQEWIFLSRTNYARWIFLAMALLMSLGWMGGYSFRYTQATNAIIRNQDAKERLDKAITTNPAEAKLLSRFRNPFDPYAAGNRFGSPYAEKPPFSYSALAVGQGDIYPDSYLITLRDLEQVVSKAAIQNPVQIYHGVMDLAFIIAFILPLLIIGYMYNIRSDEEEQNRMGWILSSGITMKSFLVSRLAIRFLIFLGIFQILYFMANMGSGFIWGWEGLPMAWLTTAWQISLYFLFWALICGLVNLNKSNSISQALTLCSVWVVLCLIIPGIIQYSVNRKYPLPNRLEMISAGREASIEASQAASKMMNAFMQDHPELSKDTSNMDDFTKRLFATQLLVEEKVNPILASFDIALENQYKSIAQKVYFSPVLTAYDLLAQTGRNDFETQRDFYRQISAFHEEWKDFFNYYLSGSGTFDAKVYDQLPQFEYHPGTKKKNYHHLYLIFVPLVIIAMGTFLLRKKL